MRRALAGAGPALVAAALVEAAAGCAAAAGLARFTRWFERGDLYVSMFAATALAAALVDAALVPGWVWTRGWFRAVPMLVRLAIAVFMLAFAVATGVVAFLIVFSVLGAPVAALLDSVGWWLQALIGSLTTAALIGASGATVGLGAVLAQDADRRFGSDAFPRARTRSHLIGGVAGLLLTIGGLFAASALDGWFPAASAWLPLAALPFILMLGGLPHNALVMRDAVRGGSVPDRQAMLPRAVLCAVVLVVAGAGVWLTGL